MLALPFCAQYNRFNNNNKTQKQTSIKTTPMNKLGVAVRGLPISVPPHFGTHVQPGPKNGGPTHMFACIFQMFRPNIIILAHISDRFRSVNAKKSRQEMYTQSRIHILTITTDELFGALYAMADLSMAALCDGWPLPQRCNAKTK